MPTLLRVHGSIGLRLMGSGSCPPPHDITEAEEGTHGIVMGVEGFYLLILKMAMQSERTMNDGRGQDKCTHSP